MIDNEAVLYIEGDLTLKEMCALIMKKWNKIPWEFLKIEHDLALVYKDDNDHEDGAYKPIIKITNTLKVN